MAGNAEVMKRIDVDSKSNPLPERDPAKTTESLLAISRDIEGHASAAVDWYYRQARGFGRALP